MPFESTFGIISVRMNESQLLKEEILSLVRKASEALEKKFSLSDKPRVRLEYSRDEKFGDYSTAYALENTKIFCIEPMKLAELFLFELNQDLHSKHIFREVTVTHPGFINFRMREFYLKEYLNRTLIQGDFYARSPEIRRINLEFVSANPTGPLNIVSARAATFGDALASVLSTLGHKIDREFYVNDYGNQVRLLGVAVLLRFGELEGEPIYFQEEDDGRSLQDLILSRTLPRESYRGEYVTKIAESIFSLADLTEEIHLAWEKQSFDEIIDKLAEYAVSYNLEGQKQDLNDFGVKFDTFVSERSLHESGEVMNTLEILENSGKVYIEDDKKIFRSTAFGDDKDRVLVRDDHRPTYLLADIAYHKNKISRGYDELIDIWGPDHHGYIARLKGAMECLGFPKENFHIIICQQVNLLEDGSKVKMSKRLGNFQRMSDLIRYLGKSARDVGRYFFIMRTAEAILDFDLDLAADESDKNPVFYIQYAHARICSIFREVGEDFDTSLDTNFQWTPERSSLLFWVSRFSEEVYDAAVSREPHRIANYLQSLCKSFTKFYSAKENRLKASEINTRLQLAYICKVTQIAIQKGLELLGISAPERMDREE